MLPKDAYEALVANDVDYVPLDSIEGRISATLALIYPPGIGIVLPGERWDARAKPMLDYFLAFQDAFNRFPGSTTRCRVFIRNARTAASASTPTWSASPGDVLPYRNPTEP